MVLLFIRVPFYVLLVFIAMCAVFWLFWLSYQYLPSDWLERLLFCVSLNSWVTFTFQHCSNANLSATVLQWRRSVEKIWWAGQWGQAINCFRHFEKLVLPSIFDKSFILDDIKVAELSNNSFERKNLTFLDDQNVLW